MIDPRHPAPDRQIDIEETIARAGALTVMPVVESGALEGGAAIPRQAKDDAHAVDLWLANRPTTTQRAYRTDVRAFLIFMAERRGAVPFAAVTVGDLQAFVASLTDLAPATQARRVSSVKSLFGFCVRIGYLRFDPAVVVEAPGIKNTLAERLLEEADVQRLLALETHPRNAVLLRLLYASGLRISEVCTLCWRDAKARGEGGQITVFGKGAKTRVVLLSAATWRTLVGLRGDAGPDAPLFRSRKGGGPLDPSAVHRIVKAAAARGGLDPAVSAHWLRHAHASHSLDRGAPVHLVQQTLGHASVATTSRYLHAKPNDSSGLYLAV